MKPPVFTGTCTALITPFQSTGAIDYTAFAKQIDRQLEAGIDALCVCGTTGVSNKCCRFPSVQNLPSILLLKMK